MGEFVKGYGFSGEGYIYWYWIIALDLWMESPS